MIDKNYFLTRLANGEDINTIGQNIADMMNEAVAEHAAKVEAEKAAKEKELKAQRLLTAKRSIAEDFIGLIEDYAELVYPESADLFEDYTNEDLDAMIETLDQMFQLLRLTKQYVEAQPVVFNKPANTKATKSDDEVLANFIKSLM